MEIIFDCYEDGALPPDTDGNKIKAVYVDSVVGWLLVEDFKSTRNGNTYKFII